MPRWTVRTRDEIELGVRADRLEVRSGMLIFYHLGSVLIAYAPHAWNTVYRDED